MPSKAKTKGSSWERQLCQILKDVFGGNFQRVPNSGAFTGMSNSYRKDSMDANQIRLMKGDIIPADHMSKLVIECKFYSDMSFHQLLREDHKQLDTWINQTLEAADKSDFWLLCIKLNNKGSFVLFDGNYLESFSIGNHFRYKTYVFTDLKSFLIDNKEKILDITM